MSGPLIIDSRKELDESLSLRYQAGGIFGIIYLHVIVKDPLNCDIKLSKVEIPSLFKVTEDTDFILIPYSKIINTCDQKEVLKYTFECTEATTSLPC